MSINSTMLIVRALRRRPQYRLKALFALITVISAPLAYWGATEHAYRVRQEAVNHILAEPYSCVHLEGAHGDRSWEYRLSSERPRPLRRDDVVAYVSCPLSERAVAAILRLPTIADLEAHDTTGDWGNPPALGSLDDVLRKLTKLPALKDLNLCGTSVSGNGLSDLKALRSLRTLSLRQTRITDGALQHLAAMPWLEEIDLSYTAVTDIGIRHLSAVTSLRVLNLSFTKVSGAGLAHFTSLHRLEELHLSHAPVDDEGIRCLPPLTCLRTLDLDETKISGAALAHLSRIPSLERLVVGGNDVGDESLQYLAELPTLTTLHLAGTRVTNEGVRILSRFQFLEELTLCACAAVCDDALRWLIQMPALKRVDLDGTSVTRRGVAELERLAPGLNVEVLVFADESEIAGSDEVVDDEEDDDGVW